jgi:hypothetical protein
MSTVSQSKCPFCNENASAWIINNYHGYYGYNCPVCKSFFITQNAIDNCNSSLGSQAILNCISENIKTNASYGREIITSWHLRSETNLPVMNSNVTIKRLEDFYSLRVEHAWKSEQLLAILGNKASQGSPFSEVTLSLTDLYLLKIANMKECLQWLNQLLEKDFIDSIYVKSKMRTIGNKVSNDELESCKIELTPKGWSQIEESKLPKKTNKVFIAMQFHWEDNLNEKKVNYVEAVKLGCLDCGYEADIVSQEHTDQITDKIVAEIKSSSFVIADFSFNNQGVYYEAGLARGLGKKVIHTVLQGHTSDAIDSFKRLHFDIRQINYLEWSDTSELREKIKNRIKSVIEE